MAHVRKLIFISSVLLWSTLLFGEFTIAQDDPCEIYGNDYVCDNNTRTPNSVPFDDPLTCDQNLYENVMKLLDDGQKILEEEFALTDSEEAVMMIGNSGTGKSTLTYFLAGDNRKMFSYSMGTDLFLIKDCNGKIGSGDSTIVSATIYPDLVIENSTETPFYDNPGFQDTRTACIEIANAFFMQKIANHIKKVKFIIIVNKFEVSPGGSREDFPRVLRNVFNFIPNIEKFGSALGLVATKLAAMSSNDLPYVKDVVNFMNTSKVSFPEIFQNPDELRQASFIVDSIMNVSRVGVFRMPVECGPLSEIELMQKNKANIMKVISENIQYVQSSPADFGVTISSESQVKVQKVGVELNAKIQNSIQNFSSAIYNYFLLNFGCVQQNSSNCDGLVEDFKILFSNPDFVKEYDPGDFVGLNFKEVVSRIVNSSFIPPKIGDSLAPNFIPNVVQSAGHLDFMINLTTLAVERRLWLQPLKDMHRYLKEHVAGLISNIDQTFVKVLKELTQDFWERFEGVLKALVGGKLGNSTRFEATIVNLYKTSFDLSQNSEGLDPSRYIKEISENIQLFKNGFSNEDYLNQQLLILSQLSLNLDFLTKSFNSSFNSSVDPESWVVPLTSLKSEVLDRIPLEIAEVSKSLSLLFSQLLDLFEEHISQLGGNSAEVLYQSLDIARRQFDFLNLFSKSVEKGQSRKDFITNLKRAVDSVDSVFIILGSQSIMSDMILLDGALTVLERLNTVNTVKTGNLGLIPAEWVLETREFSTRILNQVVHFASTDVNKVVQSGASATAAALTSRLRPAYEISGSGSGFGSAYYLEKQRNLITDYQKIQQLVNDLSSCTTLKCFSSKNFKILSQLSPAARIPENDLQKLPGPNSGLQVDLKDLGHNPYKISEWRKSYEDALAVLTRIKNLLKTDRPILESERLTNWGSWGSWDLCPEGTFVSGMQLKDDQCTLGYYKDCVALSGVRLFCSRLDSTFKSRTIMSLPEYQKGEWREEFTCPNGLKAVGFEMNVEPPRYIYQNQNQNHRRHHGDKWPWSSISFPPFSFSWSWASSNETSSTSTGWFSLPGADACGGGGGGDGGGWVPPPTPPPMEAAVNMRLVCEDGTVLEGDSSRDSSYGGTWSGKKSCKTGQYLCGLRTQIEFDAGEDGDMTGLNNLDVKCCYIVS